jgi:excisionase family DNA binding protein
MRDAADSRAELEIDRSDPMLASGVEPLLLTIPQAARVLAVGRTTVYELIAAGDLEAVHIGRSVRVPVEAVRAFVDHQRVSR